MSATTAKPTPEVEFPLTTTEAFKLAAWYTRFALDRLPNGKRSLHPGVRAHGIGAQVQLEAVERLLNEEANTWATAATGSGAAQLARPPGAICASSCA